MTEFKLALVIGGLAFAASIIPFVPYTLNFCCRLKSPAPPTDNLEYFKLPIISQLFIRNMTFALVSLLLLFLALECAIVPVAKICFQLILFVIYLCVLY